MISYYLKFKISLAKVHVHEAQSTKRNVLEVCLISQYDSVSQQIFAKAAFSQEEVPQLKPLLQSQIYCSRGSGEYPGRRSKHGRPTARQQQQRNQSAIFQQYPGVEVWGYCIGS